MLSLDPFYMSAVERLIAAARALPEADRTRDALRMVLECDSAGIRIDERRLCSALNLNPDVSQLRQELRGEHDDIAGRYAEVQDALAANDEEAYTAAIERLRRLQTKEADAMRAHHESARVLHPADGLRALERAEALLGKR